MTQLLRDHIDQNEHLARLVAHTQRLSKIQTLLVQVLPEALANGIQVGNLTEEGVLVLLAQGNAAAAKIRQLAATIQAHLREQAIFIVRIKVRVGIFNPVPMPVVTPRSVPAQAKVALQALGDQLSEDHPLKAALARLVQNTSDAQSAS